MNNSAKNSAAKVLIVAIATGLCGAAFAGGKEHGDHAMKMMDADGDGKVTAAEHAAGAKAMFTAMDTSKDGKVTAAEMDASRSAKKGNKDHNDARMSHEMTSAEKIKTIDTDGDGVLTAKEHEMGSAKMYTRMDADGDGSLTAQEIQKGHKAMMSAKDHE